jgi:hypothetical protein
VLRGNAVPQHLNVAVNQRVLLTAERPDAAIAGALTTEKVERLSDLVRLGVVKSDQELDRLINAAKAATAAALADSSTLSPANRLPGRRTLMDLRRFPRVLSEVPDANRLAVDTVWRIVRRVEPSAVAAIDGNTNLSDMRIVGRVTERWDEIHHFRFANVTVEAGAVLDIAPDVHVFSAGDLLIRRTGRIDVRGASLVIRAESIQGEQ